MSLIPLLCLLLCADEPPAQEPAAAVQIHLPDGTSDVPRDALLIITSEEPLLILQVPDTGVLRLKKIKSPLSIASRFADGDGTLEFREYTQAHVWVATAGVAGATELLLIQEGVESEDQIVRRSLTVGGPRPPPGPGPGPGPGPQPDDVLRQAHAADRASQIVILRSLAAKNLPRDAAGLTAAKDYVNAERIRRRIDDFGIYTDAIGEAIYGGTVSQLADKLEGKQP